MSAGVSGKTSGSEPTIVGIDLGGTNLQFGLVDEANTIVARTAAKTEAGNGLDHVISVICRGVQRVCAEAKVAPDAVHAVGIAAAGAIDIPRGVVLSAPNLGWIDIPFRDMLAERLGRPVVLENDVNGAVWSEYHLGPAAGRGDVLGVWIGTGVGGGLVLGGRLHHGAFFTAGEIGHTIILPDAPSGARTVEDLCSRTAFREIIAARLAAHADSKIAAMVGDDPSRIGTAELEACYAARDELVVEVIDRGADLLGTAIANWVTTLAIDRVILGGGITEALGAPYVDRVRASFDRTVFPPTCRACRFDVTALEADAGLLGAAMLAREAISRDCH